MSIQKRILLARPHAFIVNQMVPFLRDAGYEPVGAQSLQHLVQELGTALHGAIISTALNSIVGVDAATTFRMVRERLPKLPVVFAGMADMATMLVTAERAVKALVPAPTVVGPQDYRAVGAPDRATTFLVLRKEDLIASASLEVTLRALRTHFG